MSAGPNQHTWHDSATAREAIKHRWRGRDPSLPPCSSAQKKYREHMRELGLCVICAAAERANGTVRCTGCAKKARESARRWRYARRLERERRKLLAEQKPWRTCVCHGIFEPDGDDHVFPRRGSTPKGQRLRPAR